MALPPYIDFERYEVPTGLAAAGVITDALSKIAEAWALKKEQERQERLMQERMALEKRAQDFAEVAQAAAARRAAEEFDWKKQFEQQRLAWEKERLRREQEFQLKMEKIREDFERDLLQLRQKMEEGRVPADVGKTLAEFAAAKQNLATVKAQGIGEDEPTYQEAAQAVKAIQDRLAAQLGAEYDEIIEPALDRIEAAQSPDEAEAIYESIRDSLTPAGQQYFIMAARPVLRDKERAARRAIEEATTELDFGEVAPAERVAGELVGGLGRELRLRLSPLESILRYAFTKPSSFENYMREMELKRLALYGIEPSGVKPGGRW